MKGGEIFLWDAFKTNSIETIINEYSYTESRSSHELVDENNLLIKKMIREKMTDNPESGAKEEKINVIARQLREVLSEKKEKSLDTAEKCMHIREFLKKKSLLP